MIEESHIMTLPNGSNFTDSKSDHAANGHPLLAFVFLLAEMVSWSAVATSVAIYFLMWPLYIAYINRSAEDRNAPKEIANLPVPPGSYGLPIIGEAFSWMIQGANFNRSRRKQYGNVFTTNVLSIPIVKLTGHEYVQKILLGEHTVVSSVWPQSVRDLLGANGLVNSRSEVHSFKRKVSSKAFTPDALDSYLVAIKKITDEKISLLATYEQPQPIYNHMLRQTFEVAVNALLGLDVTEKAHLDALFVNFNTLVNNIFCVPKLPFFGYAKGMAARKTLMRLLHDLIQKVKKTASEDLAKLSVNDDEALKKYVKSGKGAIDIILREKMVQKLKNKNESDQINDLTLKDMAIELMFAGYFTSASAITSCVRMIARRPDTFHMCEEELASFGFLNQDMTLPEQPANIDRSTIGKMKFLDKVVKETLRIRPPVLGAYRRAIKTFQVGNYKIPKGWYVIYNIRDTHEFECGSNEPEFDPENFEENKEKRFSYLPFGGGPRMCIGKKYAQLLIKVTMIKMMMNYSKLELRSSLKDKHIPTLRPVDGLPVKLTQRRRQS